MSLSPRHLGLKLMFVIIGVSSVCAGTWLARVEAAFRPHPAPLAAAFTLGGIVLTLCSVISIFTGGGRERPARRFDTILPALSLLLSVAAVVLWVRSYWVIDHVSVASDRLHRAASGGGGVFLESLRVFRHKRSWRNQTPTTVDISILNYAERHDQYPEPDLLPPTAPRWAIATYTRPSLLAHAWGDDLNLALPHVSKIARAKQNIWNSADNSTFHDSLYGPRVWVPYWLVVAVTAPLPARHFITLVRRSRRIARNRCPSCNYDLRATPDRCPECGTVPASSVTVPSRT